jgi:hypothetical protein
MTPRRQRGTLARWSRLNDDKDPDGWAALHGSAERVEGSRGEVVCRATLRAYIGAIYAADPRRET